MEEEEDEAEEDEEEEEGSRRREVDAVEEVDVDVEEDGSDMMRRLNIDLPVLVVVYRKMGQAAQ